MEAFGDFIPLPEEETILSAWEELKNAKLQLKQLNLSDEAEREQFFRQLESTKAEEVALAEQMRINLDPIRAKMVISHFTMGYPFSAWKAILLQETLSEIISNCTPAQLQEWVRRLVGKSVVRLPLLQEPVTVRGLNTISMRPLDNGAPGERIASVTVFADECATAAAGESLADLWIEDGSLGLILKEIGIELDPFYSIGI